jgi:hypothetical protein
MTAPDFHVVDEHVARNPVARAIARRKLLDATRDFSIRLHMLDDGEQVASDAHTSAHVLAVAIGVCIDTGHGDGPQARVMMGGMRALEDLACRAFRWRRLDAQAVAIALEHAVEVYGRATAHQTHRAWRRVLTIERQEGLLPLAAGTPA